jgi:hypothetical protein
MKKKKKPSKIPRNPAALPAKMRKGGKMKDKKDKRAKENHNKDWSSED